MLLTHRARLGATLVLAALSFGTIPALSTFAEPGYPVTVRDASGYALTLPAAPRAIVSLTLTSDEILFDLVAPGRLRAIEVFATDPGISNVADRAQSVPLKVTGEKETILSLQPDLVFVADWKEPEFIQALRDAKVPVFVVRAPNTFADLTTAVTQIATLVGEPDKGKALLATVDQRLQAVATRVAGVAPEKRVSVLSYSFWGSTYAKGTSFDTLVDRAGLVNAATRAGLAGWPQLSTETLLQLDPDVIVLPSWSYDGKADPNQFLKTFLADPAFAGLKAVKNRRVLILPDRHLQSNSQYMVDGVEDLARAAYPDLFR